MSIIAWIVVGAIAGWIASKVVPGDEGYGVFGGLIAGIVGAVVGGFLFGALTNTDWTTGINIGTLVAAIVGASSSSSCGTWSPSGAVRAPSEPSFRQTDSPGTEKVPGVFVSSRRYNRAVPDPAYETLLSEADAGVLTVTLNRPEALNALNAVMRRELLAAVKDAGRDAEVRAIVITGAGRGFCAGADLRGGSGEREFRRVLTDEYNPLIEAIRRVPKPVVASVNGVAAGAGVSLAFAADLVVAATEARFVPAFNRIALVPDSGLTRTLVRALGRHRALEVLLGERELNADQAHDAGLVAAVVPTDRLPDVT